MFSPHHFRIFNTENSFDNKKNIIICDKKAHEFKYIDAMNSQRKNYVFSHNFPNLTTLFTTPVKYSPT